MALIWSIETFANATARPKWRAKESL